MNILIASLGNIRLGEIKVLAEALNKKNKVTLVSMGSHASYRGVAFSPEDVPVRAKPLLYKEVVKKETKKKLGEFDDIVAYEFDAQPADAISVMLSEVMAHKMPDLVICGISNGTHMGNDIYSSSNIGMAKMASFFGVPTIAVAVDGKVGGQMADDLKNAVNFIEKNLQTFVNMRLPKHTFLNINIPDVKTYKGIKVVPMGNAEQLREYKECIDYAGGKYYWAEKSERPADTWFEKGYITIIPMNYDSTDYDAVSEWGSRVSQDMKKLEGGKQ
ncbi:MAG: hypothetical protein FWC00_01650 [Firmicutes bacterium]|nr:hypothetical protein [Bacillota bacterium]